MRDGFACFPRVPGIKDLGPDEDIKMYKQVPGTETSSAFFIFTFTYLFVYLFMCCVGVGRSEDKQPGRWFSFYPCVLGIKNESHQGWQQGLYLLDCIVRHLEVGQNGFPLTVL